MANQTPAEFQRQLCEENPHDHSDLSALFLNCTLKPSPQTSHTRGLIDVSAGIMEANDVSVEVLRPVDHPVAHGVYPDMTEHGWNEDAWPAIQKKVMAADILVLGTPIWLGEKSSVCTQVVDRGGGPRAPPTWTPSPVAPPTTSPSETPPS
ncbi:MAG: hypothetical protein EA352_05165 [Gemmatimonadales bacterium]|nr:MAG: hypothetical protein EA352_05165 [Gemmatimonadales bacterium]